MERHHRISDPAAMLWLTGDPRAAWIWLPLRLWLGWQWLLAGYSKYGDVAWTGTGAAVRSYWEQAATVTEPGLSTHTFAWYRSVVELLLSAEAQTWFADLIVYGEILVGISLILGALTGISAFLGALIGFSILLAGPEGTSPMQFAIAVGLILAWKVAGYIGLDHWLLPVIGTPWGWASQLRAVASEDGIEER